MVNTSLFHIFNVHVDVKRGQLPYVYKPYVRHLSNSMVMHTQSYPSCFMSLRVRIIISL